MQRNDTIGFRGYQIITRPSIFINVARNVTSRMAVLDDFAQTGNGIYAENRWLIFHFQFPEIVFGYLFHHRIIFREIIVTYVFCDRSKCNAIAGLMPQAIF